MVAGGRRLWSSYKRNAFGESWVAAANSPIDSRRGGWSTARTLRLAPGARSSARIAAGSDRIDGSRSATMRHWMTWTSRWTEASFKRWRTRVSRDRVGDGDPADADARA